MTDRLSFEFTPEDTMEAALGADAIEALGKPVSFTVNYRPDPAPQTMCGDAIPLTLRLGKKSFEGFYNIKEPCPGESADSCCPGGD